MALKRKFGDASGARARLVQKVANVLRKRAQQPRSFAGKYRSPNSGTEIKYVDTVVSGNIGNSANAFSVLLNSLAAGNDDTQRIGRKITMNSIQVHYRVAASTTDLGSAQFPENSDTVRVAIVYDKQANGAAPQYNEVYQIVSAGITDPFAFRQMDQSDRFTILAVDHHTLSEPGPNSVNNSRYISCKLDAKYLGTSTGIANIGTGSVYLFAVDENTTTSTPATIAGYGRVTFTDD